jgi:prevent-host-death family protein
MTAVGIRELKNNLSRYVQDVARGDSVAITLHGRVVAELIPPRTRSTKRRSNRWDRLVASGAIHPAVESGDPLEAGGLDFSSPEGTTQEWNAWDREDDR